MAGRPKYKQCLNHQLTEDQMSPIGLVCPLCKHRLYVRPPRGHCRGFWESQPAAYTLTREPCFVYSLIWDDFRIRTLHPASSTEDPRGANARLLNTEAPQPSDLFEGHGDSWNDELPEFTDSWGE